MPWLCASLQLDMGGCAIGQHDLMTLMKDCTTFCLANHSGQQFVNIAPLCLQVGI